jgi:hypothetical protein
VKIDEVFDTNVDNVEWFADGSVHQFHFNVGKQKYTVQVNNRPIAGFQSSKTAEVSFFIRDAKTDKQAFSTTHDSKGSLKVYGVVANVLYDKFIEYDAFLFSLEKEHCSSTEEYVFKQKLYTQLAHKLSTYGRNIFIDKRTNTTEWIVSKIPPEDETYINEWVEARDNIMSRINEEDIPVV